MGSSQVCVSMSNDLQSRSWEINSVDCSRHITNYCCRYPFHPISDIFHPLYTNQVSECRPRRRLLRRKKWRRTSNSRIERRRSSMRVRTVWTLTEKSSIQESHSQLMKPISYVENFSEFLVRNLFNFQLFCFILITSTIIAKGLDISTAQNEH